MSLEPIIEEYELAVDPRDAFDVYVGHIDRWWDPRYSTNAHTFESVRFEPHVGGAVSEVHTTGVTHDWGTVTLWEPGRRLAYTSRLGQHGGDSTIVTVSFAARAADGTHLLFEHGGWNRTNAHDRAKFTQWRLLLDRYARLIEELR